MITFYYLIITFIFITFFMFFDIYLNLFFFFFFFQAEDGIRDGTVTGVQRVLFRSFEATSRTICAPIFSNLSLSSISLATVTPSLVMRGAPKLLSMTTLRPLGPSVTFTALARMSTPLRIRSRASRLNFTSLAAIWLPFRFLKSLKSRDAALIL